MEDWTILQEMGLGIWVAAIGVWAHVFVSAVQRHTTKAALTDIAETLDDIGEALDDMEGKLERPLKEEE